MTWPVPSARHYSKATVATTASAQSDVAASSERMGEFVKTREGVQMPRMMYGTAWKAERTADLVEAAIRAGFRGVDTACQPKHYREVRRCSLTPG
jgi:hypothetical protein